VGPIPSVGLTLTWSMGRKLALHITLYHSIFSKHRRLLEPHMHKWCILCGWYQYLFMQLRCGI